jgi:hypothetical protein
LIQDERLVQKISSTFDSERNRIESNRIKFIFPPTIYD